MVVSTILIGGCHGYSRMEAVTIANPDLGKLTIAVAPAVNQSGSAYFDPNRFADLMASELSHVQGIRVIPVSRVLGVLATQGVDQVLSPKHAYELSGLLGADAILVFSVTEYDPYDPPSIGISAQLYGSPGKLLEARLDPVALSKHKTQPAAQSTRSPKRLLGQSQQVFNASHRAIIDDVRLFARKRNAEDSPLGWRKYIVSQQHYIRYCCHATLRALFTPERNEIVVAGTNSRKKKHGHDSTIVVGQR